MLTALLVSAYLFGFSAFRGPELPLTLRALLLLESMMEGWWQRWELCPASPSPSAHARGSNCCCISVRVQARMGQREHLAPEETKEQGQKHLGMQLGRTPVFPHSPRGAERLQRGSAKMRLQLSVCTCEIAG